LVGVIKSKIPIVGWLNLQYLDDTGHQTSLFNHNSPWFKAFLILIFLLAALIRRDEIKAPGHLIEREYNSAIFARAFYFVGNPNIELWRQENARVTRDQFPLLEPPVTEYLVAIVYGILGKEEIWYARYLTSAFWLIGGLFFYKIVKNLISADAALFAVVYYLFVPWGIIISRSFQPDSLMMMMFMISLYFMVVYFEKPLWRRLLLAGIITGMTLLFRPLVIFPLLGAFTALSIQKNGIWKFTFDKQFIVFILLSLAFPITFYGYGIYIAGFLSGQAALSFRPHLLFRFKFWRDWFELGTGVVGHTAVIAAVLGFSFLRKSRTQMLAIGLLVGYFIFGMVFTFHISTHPYYHLQLIPLIAICSSLFLVNIGNTIKDSLGKNWLALVFAIFLFVIFVNHREVRESLYTKAFEDPNLAAEIGEVIDHSPRTVFVASHYGGPLEYYGQFSGAPWPVNIDDPFYRPPDEKERSVLERLNGLNFEPEYFVITDFGLFNRKHKDLKAYLEENCSIFSKQDQYLIYNSCLPVSNDKY
jgi:hypothetical protein